MMLLRLLGATALASTLPLLATPAAAQNATPGASPIVNDPQAHPSVDAPAGSQTSPAAAVQEQGPAQGGADGGADVVVTGSRIRARGANIDEAVPVTTVSAAELLGSRGSTSLGDALNQLPQLRSTFSQANSTASIGTAGLNLLDLRGLQPSRTLTLVNGRRVVSAVPGSYTPDVNTIPSDLVERVDIVTGGNSAIYGSDAVAGVVNFVLRRDFEGVRVRAQSGITTYGDRGDRLVSALVGHNFSDGKVNLTASLQYSKADPLFYSDRAYRGAYTGVPGFVNNEPTTAPNRNADGIPNTKFVSGITFGNISTGGYITTSCPVATATNAARRAAVCAPIYSPGLNGQSGPGVTNSSQLAYNFAFQPNGSLLRDDPSQGLIDRRATSGGISGGLSATGVENAMLDPGLENITGNILMHADFSDAFKPFVEASYTHVNALQQSTQPTFISGSPLNGTFLLTNPFLTPAAVSTLQTILAPGATSFTMLRFNNDIGTRAEDHKRDTYRGVIGVEGDFSHVGNLHYELAFNYGRTDNYYHTGGNVLTAAYNRATNAVLAPAGYTGSNFVLNYAGAKVVCGVNANASTADDDPACYPLNVFGQYAGDPRAVNYVLYNSERRQWAQEIDATGFISGDSTGLFRLPGGPVAFVIGGEYRQERAYSNYDPTTDAGLTFLNGSSPFAPPAVNIKEGFGELSVPLIKDVPVLHELTVQGAGRISDYGGSTGSVVAWDAGVNWAPVRDLHFKGTLSRSVRAPNLSNLYATPSVTFANGLTDPCDQVGNPGGNASNNVAAGPNRAKNCAAAGIPTTISYVDQSTGKLITVPWYNVAGSGVAGSNQGNPGLVPEIGYSFTVSGIFEPHWVPGLSLGATYYNIRVKNVISSLTGQQIINRCYDDAGGIDNPFCAAVFRRPATGNSATDFTFNGETVRQFVGQPNVSFPAAGNGLGFIAQPFNFAKLATRGMDFEGTYRREFMPDVSATFHLTASLVMDRLSYSYIAEPGRYDRIESTLGDPKWQGAFNVQFQIHNFELGYNERYVGKQIVSGLSYETFYSSQGRPAINPETRPFVYYLPVVYHNLRLGYDLNDKFRTYIGADNLTNELPPYEIAGNGSVANGDAIYPNIGRFLYVGVEAKF